MKTKQKKKKKLSNTTRILKELTIYEHIAVEEAIKDFFKKLKRERKVFGKFYRQEIYKKLPQLIKNISKHDLFLYIWNK